MGVTGCARKVPSHSRGRSAGINPCYRAQSVANAAASGKKGGATVEYLLGLFVALFLITLVGHGIWVVLAKLFQVVSDVHPSESKPSSVHRFQERCLNCAEPLRPAYSLCPRCGMSPSVARRMAD